MSEIKIGDYVKLLKDPELDDAKASSVAKMCVNRKALVIEVMTDRVLCAGVGFNPSPGQDCWLWDTECVQKVTPAVPLKAGSRVFTLDMLRADHGADYHWRSWWLFLMSVSRNEKYCRVSGLEEKVLVSEIRIVPDVSWDGESPIDPAEWYPRAFWSR